MFTLIGKLKYMKGFHKQLFDSTNIFRIIGLLHFT